MKALIAILVIVVVIFVGWKLLDYWDDVAKEREARQQAVGIEIDPKQLSGLPQQLEAPLEAAYKKGAPGLKEWLEKAKNSPQIKDPRLAWIELDYVMRISRDHPAEAKRVFAGVKDRTPPQSPIYPRVKALEKTFE
jgi:hypothetical protein